VEVCVRGKRAELRMDGSGSPPLRVPRLFAIKSQRPAGEVDAPFAGSALSTPIASVPPVTVVPPLCWLSRSRSVCPRLLS
jgi:hypothetical protein